MLEWVDSGITWNLYNTPWLEVYVKTIYFHCRVLCFILNACRTHRLIVQMIQLQELLPAFFGFLQEAESEQIQLLCYEPSPQITPAKYPMVEFYNKEQNWGAEVGAEGYVKPRYDTYLNTRLTIRYTTQYNTLNTGEKRSKIWKYRNLFVNYFRAQL